MAVPYEIFIGLRYLRAKRRDRTISFNTIVSVTGITLGVAALIGTLGIMTGFQEDVQTKILGTTSHILIHDRMRENLTGYQPLISKTEQVPHVVAATPFIFRQVLLTSDSGVQGVVLRGIDPKNEVRVTDLGNNLKAGDLADLEKSHPAARPAVRASEPKPSPGERPGSAKEPEAAPSAEEGGAEPTPPPMRPGIVVGKELAMRLSVFVGDELNVVSPVGNVRAVTIVPKIRTFKVVGVFQTGMYEYDSSLAYVSLKDAQQFFNMGDTVTGVEVKVDDIFQAAPIARTIEQALGLEYWARDWMQLNRNLFSALKLEKTMMFLLLVLVTIVASFNIVSTLTMIVTEKQREIAILKAMGATRKGIMRIFMLNGLVIGVTGTTLGIPLGYAVLWLIQTYYTFDPTVYYISKIPVHVKALDVSLVGFTALLISLTATLYPSLKAAKLDPAAALRYQ